MTLAKTFVVVGLTAGLLCSSLLASASPDNHPQQPSDPIEAQASTLSLSAAVEVALADNPSLATMQSRAKAMADIPSQVGTLSDPQLRLNALNLPVDSFNVGQEGMTQMQVGISQAFPFPTVYFVWAISTNSRSNI